MARLKQDQDQSKVKFQKRVQGILEKYRQEGEEEFFTYRISTGSLSLDSYLKGIRPGVIRLAGYNNEGKTPEALEIARNFVNTVPNSKVFFVQSEGRLSEENKTRCQLKFVYDFSDWEVGTVLVMVCNVYDDVIDVFRELVKDNPNDYKYCLIVDSIDGLMVEENLADTSKGSKGKKPAKEAVMAKDMMRRIAIAMVRFGHLMILTSQVTSSFDIGYSSEWRSVHASGGNALLHWSDFIIEFQAVPSFDKNFFFSEEDANFRSEDSKTIGKYCKVRIQKSIQEHAKYQYVSYPIKYGQRPSGIWIEQDLIPVLIGLGYLEKPEKGAWYTFEKSLLEEVKEAGYHLEEKIQGEKKIREFFEADPALTSFLHDKMLSLFLSDPDTDLRTRIKILKPGETLEKQNEMEKQEG